MSQEARQGTTPHIQRLMDSRLWIMGFADKAWHLYEGSKETPNWTWAEPMKQAFQTLRWALLEAPALACLTQISHSSCL